MCIKKKYIYIIWHSQIVTSHLVRILALLFPRTSFRNFPLVVFGRQMSSSLVEVEASMSCW